MEHSRDSDLPVSRATVSVPPMLGLGDVVYVRLVAEALEQTGFVPDVIHCNITLPVGLGALYLKKKLGVPVVLTEHSSDFRLFYTGTAWARVKARRALRGVDRVLPVGEGQRKMMEAFEPRPTYVTIPNAIDTEMFSPGTNSRRPGPIRALTVLGLWEHKGIQFLLQAYARLPEQSQRALQLTILGSGPYENALFNLRDQLGIADSVQFLPGGRSKAEIATLMRECDFLVHPSLREATPCVIIEAMACGKPVLVTRCGASEYLVGPASGKIVEKGDADALAEGLQEMMDEYRRYDASRLALTTAQKYSYSAIGRRFDEVYRELTVP